MSFHFFLPFVEGHTSVIFILASIGRAWKCLAKEKRNQVNVREQKELFRDFEVSSEEERGKVCYLAARSAATALCDRLINEPTPTIHAMVETTSSCFILSGIPFGTLERLDLSLALTLFSLRLPAWPPSSSGLSIFLWRTCCPRGGGRLYAPLMPTKHTRSFCLVPHIYCGGGHQSPFYHSSCILVFFICLPFGNARSPWPRRSSVP